MARMYDVNTVNAAMMQAAEICREKLPEGDKLKKVLACFAGMESVEAVAVEKYESLQRRLCHLLKSKYITSFDIVHPFTQKYVRDIAEADAVPLVHGRWEKSDIPHEKYCCSACGGACWYYDYEGDVARSRYCPNCGAKMDGGAEA